VTKKELEERVQELLEDNRKLKEITFKQAEEIARLKTIDSHKRKDVREAISILENTLD
jgi:ribosomal protein L11